MRMIIDDNDEGNELQNLLSVLTMSKKSGNTSIYVNEYLYFLMCVIYIY